MTTPTRPELFHFLADKLCGAETSSRIVVMKGEYTVSNKKKSVDGMAPCSHEDTWMFVHARDATVKCSKFLIMKAQRYRCSCHSCIYAAFATEVLAFRECGLHLAKAPKSEGYPSMKWFLP